MEEMVLNIGDFKVLMVSGGSVLLIELLEMIQVGQPFINVFIGILTCIYLIKRIFQKNNKE